MQLATQQSLVFGILRDSKEERAEAWIKTQIGHAVCAFYRAPVPGVAYRIILPDGETVAECTLDNKGFARIDGIKAGTYKITFPEVDQDAWRRA